MGHGSTCRNLPMHSYTLFILHHLRIPSIGLEEPQKQWGDESNDLFIQRIIKKGISRVGNAALSFVFHPSIFLSYIESEFLLLAAKYDYLSTWIQATLIKRHTYNLQEFLLMAMLSSLATFQHPTGTPCPVPYFFSPS